MPKQKKKAAYGTERSDHLLTQEYYVFGVNFGACCCRKVRGSEIKSYQPNIKNCLEFWNGTQKVRTMPGRDFHSLSVTNLYSQILQEQQRILEEAKTFAKEQEVVLRQYRSEDFKKILQAADGTSYEQISLTKIKPWVERMMEDKTAKEER